MNDTREWAVAALSGVLDGKKAENVERSVYNFTIQKCDEKCIPKEWNNSLFVHVYKQRITWVLHKLENSPTLLQDINSKNVLAKDVGFLSEKDLERGAAGDVLDVEESVSDGIFQCRKCGSKKTTYYSLQTRSADEPMTNFITCVTCGNRWKM